MTHHYRHLFVGLDAQVPLLDGTQRIYINLDNAASTPSLKHSSSTVQNYLEYYSSVHRGTGFKSQLCTHAYEQARQLIMRFVGADPHVHTCIFGKNTTEAINKLAHRFPFSSQKNIVLVSLMEHHSNDLPWRGAAHVVHIGVTSDGQLDEEEFDRAFQKYGQHIALVAVTGASNVTGFINPVHRLAEKTHALGAQISVDCAQLAPHRRINMLSPDDPAHLDYISISAHKMYAPFGTGALIGLRQTFEEGSPDLQGGGEVEIVTVDQVVWSDPPEREEAGSPNTVGAVALAASAALLNDIGMDVVARHEAELTAYALERLAHIPNLQIFGDAHPDRAAARLGVIPINIKGMSHYLVAAILGYEFGIGVRNGCFCAHPYLLHLMHVGEKEANFIRNEIIQGDRRNIPGMVRISFGLYNTIDEIDALVHALERIQKGDYIGKYTQNKANGEFVPSGWQVSFEDYFSFEKF